MSELSVILADLRRIASAFDFTDDDLGTRALDVVAGGILRNMDDELDPDDTPWPALSDAYAERKAQVAPGQPMAVLMGIMKTPEQVAGLRRVVPAEAVMEYGTTELARAEATAFQEGNDRQPPRPFYGITVVAAQLCDELFDRRFLDAVEG